MYGNVDAALEWQKAFIKLFTNKEIQYIQSETGLCMLYKKYKEGKTSLIITAYLDDELISGSKTI